MTLPFVVEEAEDVDCNRELVPDFRDVFDGDWIMDGVESVFFEEVCVVSRSIGVLFVGLMIECREEGETEAAIVLVFDVDDSLLGGEELRELAIRATLSMGGLGRSSTGASGYPRAPFPIAGG